MNTIETERLTLALYSEADENEFVSLLTDPDVMRYVDKGVLTQLQARAMWQKLNGTMYPQGVDTIWAVFAKSDERYVGNASIRPRPENRNEWEIGYYLKTDEWGKGYATELAERLARYAFDSLGLKEVFATVDPQNEASRKVLTKANFSLHRNEYDEQGMFHVYRAVRP